MPNDSFRIIPLKTEAAEGARVAVRNGAPDHAYVTADAPTSYPCRHCLRWAETGEEMILFPYASIPSGHPYAETGPIFVHAESCLRYERTDRYPADFRKGRVLRAYNEGREMIDAELVAERDPETVIENLLQNPETSFLQVRSADRGCFTFALVRA